MSPTVHEVSGDALINTRHLPFFFLIPEDMMARFPTLSTLPRRIGDFAIPEHRDTVMSEMLLDEIWKAMAALVFPHLGFRGWLEQYSSDSPVWKLAYAAPYWIKALEAETGMGLQWLFLLDDNTVIPYFDAEQVHDIMSRVVKRGLADNNLQPVLDIVKEIPCEEDFEKWDTNIRRDFLRSWYHYRSKNVQTVSLESCLEDEEHPIYDIEDESANIEDIVVAEDYYQRFKDRLSPKDMEILQMRVDGFTYEEIAKTLGYKTHSAVLKRMQSITKSFIKYEEGQ